MQEFEAAWNIVGIVCSWVFAGILATVLVGLILLVVTEYF